MRRIVLLLVLALALVACGAVRESVVCPWVSTTFSYKGVPCEGHYYPGKVSLRNRSVQADYMEFVCENWEHSKIFQVVDFDASCCTGAIRLLGEDGSRLVCFSKYKGAPWKCYPDVRKEPR